MTYKVERWGGQPHHKRRVVFIGSSDLAWKKYWKLYDAARQGIVELVNENGETVAKIHRNAKSL